MAVEAWVKTTASGPEESAIGVAIDSSRLREASERSMDGRRMLSCSVKDAAQI